MNLKVIICFICINITTYIFLLYLVVRRLGLKSCHVRDRRNILTTEQAIAEAEQVERKERDTKDSSYKFVNVLQRILPYLDMTTFPIMPTGHALLLGNVKKLVGHYVIKSDEFQKTHKSDSEQGDVPQNVFPRECMDKIKEAAKSD